MGMTRRASGGLLALALLVGGSAACSDDDDGGGDGGDQATTTVAGGGAGPDAGEGGEVEAANDAIIQEYCDASIANDEALQASLDDPDDEAARDALAGTSGRLGEASDAVAPVVETFTPEQQAQFEECQS